MQHQGESGLLLDVVVRQSAAIFELLASKDKQRYWSGRYYYFLPFPDLLSAMWLRAEIHSFFSSFSGLLLFVMQQQFILCKTSSFLFSIMLQWAATYSFFAILHNFCCCCCLWFYSQLQPIPPSQVCTTSFVICDFAVSCSQFHLCKPAEPFVDCHTAVSWFLLTNTKPAESFVVCQTAVSWFLLTNTKPAESFVVCYTAVSWFLLTNTKPAESFVVCQTAVSWFLLTNTKPAESFVVCQTAVRCSWCLHYRSTQPFVVCDAAMSCSWYLHWRPAQSFVVCDAAVSCSLHCRSVQPFVVCDTAMNLKKMLKSAGIYCQWWVFYMICHFFCLLHIHQGYLKTWLLPHKPKAIFWSFHP